MTKPKPKSPAKPTKLSTPRSRPPAETRSGPPDVGPLFERIASILEDAQARVVRSVNSAMVLACWQIGREIVQTLQGGDPRAEYGNRLMADLSKRLTQRFGRGYSATNLWYFRQFYAVYADRRPEILHAPSGESTTDQKRREPGDGSSQQSQALELAAQNDAELGGFSPLLSWTHYRTLAKVESPTARRFYEIEAAREGWSVVQLERQIHTQLFARLLKSRDKAGVMDLASRGQVLERPVDILKDPFVLDFLDLPDSAALRESDLESAILGKLSHFLLELGKGFAFVARQKRLSFDDEHFYVDLVFYNVILKCFLLIDLKLGKLTHRDIGQMDGYVRLFDEQGRTDGDGPTVGLILCAEKNEAVARYSVLHENERLFAARYLTYLPSEQELAEEIAREKRLLEARQAPAPSPGKRRQPAARMPRARKERS
jgi:predicted nuclease of restriction endonuclease-like (RecB) superfamily